jgi:BirA family transcriptional regulator, biotin operon repressor / biotin---[acetyl-CoA-carboxylase] ligase
MTSFISTPLDPDKIKINLKTTRIGKKIVVYNSTASTNDAAAKYAKSKNNDGLVVLAEEQVKGRGRSGNKWLSGKGDSVICSILLTESDIDAELLSLTIAVATAQAIGKCTKAEAKIKWPNDIILNNKKVAGILVESKKAGPSTALRTGKNAAFIIGIGINCHQAKIDFPAELRKTATSIDIETGGAIDRTSLIKRLLVSIEASLEIAEQKKDEIIEDWRRLSTQLGQRVSLVYNKKKFAGNCIGIDPENGLILQLDTGGIRMFHAAQTTVAKS